MNNSNDIYWVPREKIDSTAWDELINNSTQHRIYANTVWLDCMCPSWSALINQDFTVVMPLASYKKYGVPYLAQPAFTQQLGLYSLVPVSATIKNKFLAVSQSHFRFAEIYSNEPFAPEISRVAKNYVLHLSNDYVQIKKGYSKSLIANSLKPALNQQLQYSIKLNIDTAILLYQQLYQNKMHLHPEKYNHLKILAKKLAKEKKCFTRQVINTEHEILAISLFFRDHHRIYNLCSATTAAGRKTNANYFLYDSLIQELATSGLILDFEGSNIHGIETFYKKFGAQLEPYYSVKWNHLKWPYKIFKK